MISKTRNWFTIINIPNKIKDDLNNDKDALIKYLEGKILELDVAYMYDDVNYYAIVHHSDVHQNGTPKEIHLHIIVQFVNARHKDAVIKELSSILKLDRNLITATPCDSIYGAVQYLTHKNDRDKYQYNYYDIYSNEGDKLKYYYNYEELELTTDDLVNYIDKGFTRKQILLEIGKDTYRKNAYMINSLLQEREKERNEEK